MKRLNLFVLVLLMTIGFSPALQARAMKSNTSGTWDCVSHGGRTRAMKSNTSGTWDCVSHGGRNGDLPFTLYLKQSGTTVTGWVSSSLGDADISSATFKKRMLRIEIDTDQGNYLITGKLAHGKMAGHWSHENESGRVGSSKPPAVRPEWRVAGARFT
jgi:hypothetical protein